MRQQATYNVRHDVRWQPVMSQQAALTYITQHNMVCAPSSRSGCRGLTTEHVPTQAVKHAAYAMRPTYKRHCESPTAHTRVCTVAALGIAADEPTARMA